MTKQHSSTAWAKAVRGLCAQLALDAHNHWMLADPWKRAVHSMVQSWRIRQSQGPKRKPKRTPKSPRSWAEFARMAVAKEKAALRRPRPGTWEYWAKLRTHALLRYVRKDLREPPP